VTNDDYGEERDPLLVRPYLRDAGTPGDDQSTQTWPSATTREVRSQRALEGADDPTAVLFLPEAKPARRGRRMLLVFVACAVVLVGAAAAGFATLRLDRRPGSSAALPDAPIPALSGLVPTSPAAPPAPVSAAPSTGKSASRHATTAPPKATSANATSATNSPGAPAPNDNNNDGKTTSPPAGLLPAVPSDRTGTIRGQNGLCLDLNGAVAVDFNHVQVFDCNDTAAQTWTLATDGTLRVLGKCALVVGDNTVRITTCDGRTTAQWRVSGQQLINGSNALCLTDPSSGTTAGTGVTVTTCTGRANQRWSFP
jgi:hypothetical protein